MNTKRLNSKGLNANEPDTSLDSKGFSTRSDTKGFDTRPDTRPDTESGTKWADTRLDTESDIKGSGTRLASKEPNTRSDTRPGTKGADTKKLVIRSEHVWLEDGWEPAVIVVDTDTGRICEVLQGSASAPCGCDGSRRCGEELLLKQTYILPGLIDCHTHAGMAGPGGDRLEDLNDPFHFDTPFFRAVDAADLFSGCFSNAEKAGITTVCVLPGSGCAVGGQAGVVTTGSSDPFGRILRENAGMKVALGTQPRKCADLAKVSPQTKMALFAMIRESYLRAKQASLREGLERNSTKGLEKNVAEDLAKGLERGLTTVDPTGNQKRSLAEALAGAPARDLALEGWKPVIEGRAPLRAHCHREDDIAKLLLFTKEEGLRLVLEHGSNAVFLADELIDRDIPVVCTNTLLRVPQLREEEAISPELPAKLLKRGIRVALSTNFPEAAWDSLIAQAVFCLREGVPLRTVIESITLVPAQILGIDGETGRIAPGKWADLSFWSGEIGSFETKPLGVMTHGELRTEEKLL